MERARHHSESTAIYILGMHEDKLCIIIRELTIQGWKRTCKEVFLMLMVNATEELRVVRKGISDLLQINFPK